jgi:hypothetical protein
MAQTGVINCTCVSKAQDEFYGKGKRLANMKKDGKWKCTVCQSIKDKDAGVPR